MSFAMAIFRKKADPLSERARALTTEIAALEAQIKQLDTQLQHSQARPRLRSTARPHGAAEPDARAFPREPVFEAVDHDRVKFREDTDAPSAQINELGVRKFNLAGAWRRVTHHLHGPPANNPKLVNYLAAGSIQGLRPMRYEKRVARNRVIGLSLLLFAFLWGIYYVFFVKR